MTEGGCLQKRCTKYLATLDEGHCYCFSILDRCLVLSKLPTPSGILIIAVTEAHPGKGFLLPSESPIHYIDTLAKLPPPHSPNGLRDYARAYIGKAFLFPMLLNLLPLMHATRSYPRFPTINTVCREGTHTATSLSILRRHVPYPQFLWYSSHSQSRI